MTMPVLPKGLKVTTSGYGLSDPGGVKATEVAGGPPRYAMAYARGSQQVRCSMVLERAAFEVWTVFYFRVIGKGAVRFEMDIDTGFGAEPHGCNIVPGSYSPVRNGRLWMVSFVANVEPTVNALSEDAVELYLGIWEQQQIGIQELLNRLDQFANQDTLVWQ